MKQNKLIELIGTLSRYEKPEFEKYLASPFFNSDPTLGKAFGFLTAGEIFSSLPKKELFSHIYSANHKYDDKKVRYVCSGLQKHLEHYVTLKRFFNEPAAFRNILCKELSSRRCDKALSFHSLQAKNEKPDLHADHYFHEYIFSQTEYIHNAKGISRSHHMRYDQMSKNLDRFYCLRKLQLACELINMNNVLQTDFKQHLTEEVMAVTAQQNFFHSPLIEIYMHIYDLLNDSSGTSFPRLRELVALHEDKIDVNELKDIYQYIKNFCVKKINTGQPEYLNVLLDIYKNYLSNKRLMKQDYFSTWEFKNIVTIALRLEETEWTKKFINNFLSYLTPEDRKNASLYNFAVLHHHLRDYRKSIQLLQEVEFTDVYYALDSRSFLLKNYFELDETETLFYHISAYKIFLKRNKLISAYQRTIYNNYLKYVGKLVRTGVNPRKIQALKISLEKEKAISDKRWLMDKIEQLS